MIEVNNTTRRSIDENLLKKIAQMVLKGEKFKESGLSIALVGSDKMRKLNKQYRRKDKVANVLSFSESELGLGEVVLCPQEVEKDAKKYGMLFTEALAWMLVHGVLHLLNYDHEKDSDEKKMSNRETYYLNKLNFA